MIKKITNSDLDIAKQLYAIFQSSYKIEAKILNAIDFPPLKRPLENYLQCENDFFGYYEKNVLAGVIEIIHTTEYTHIRSLVVDPLYFRQGIAKKLMEFTLNNYDSNLFVVETGLENAPATKLYYQFGFKEVKQWDTDHGVRKIKLELQKKTTNDTSE